MLLFSTTLAWGPQAHEIIASRAQERLSAEARQALGELESRPLADLSNLPDEWRSARPDTRPLHYLNVPREATGYRRHRDCPDHRCVPAAIDHFAHVLGDPGAPRDQRREALAFVTHLVADVHQPLHVAYADDRGGNLHPIRYGGETTDLHTFWDDALPGLTGDITFAAPPAGSPSSWAEESLELTRSRVYVPEGVELSETYLTEARAIAAERIDAAAWRLAGLLEQVLVRGELLADPRPDGYDPGSSGWSGRVLGAVALLLALLGLGLAMGLRARSSRFAVLWRPAPLALLTTGALATVALESAMPLLYRHAVDVAIPSRDPDQLAWLLGVGILCLGTTLVGWLLVGGAGARLAASATATLRHRILAAVATLPLDELDELGLGSVTARLQTDLEQVERFAGRTLSQLVRSGFLFVAGVAVMADLDGRLALLTAFGLVGVVLLPRWLSERARRARDHRLDAEERLLAGVQDLWSGQRTLRDLGRAEELSNQLHTQAIHVDRAREHEVFTSSMVPITGTVGVLVLILMIVTDGAYRATQGAITVGAVTGAFASLSVVATGVGRLAGLLPSVAAARSALDRIGAVTDRIRRPVAPGSVPPLCTLAVHDLCYSHDGRTLHLDHVTFDVHAGESVAIVGPSGSGKSTLLQALLQHVGPTGDLLWNRAALTPAHRSRIATVPQQPHLFAMPLRENIRVGRPSATDSEIEAVAHASRLGPLLRRLPRGLDTMLGPEGAQLSGGERQRVALARALIRNAELLILDEATSALDPATAEAIESWLARQVCTRIAVTHDLGAARRYDRIVVLDAGRVVGEGSHDVLMESCPLYRGLSEHLQGISIAPSGARIAPARLAKVEAFATWPEPALEELAAVAGTERFDDGEVITWYGEEGDRMFLVAYGRVRVQVPRPGASDVVVNLGATGDCLGEIALVMDRRRTATLVAEGAVVLLSFRREHVLPILERYPEARAALMEAALERLSRARILEISLSRVA